MNWYKKSQVDIKQKYESLIRDYISSRGPHVERMLSDSFWSKGECDSIATDLARYISSKGVDCQVIGATGLRVPLPEDAHPEWRSFVGEDQKNREFLWHAVVKTPDAAIDITGSQYGKEFSGIRILTHQQLKDEWETFKTHPSPDDWKNGEIPEDVEL